MVMRFSDDPSRETRALQVWQILIARATNRQTITYGELARIMGYGGAGVFAPILDYIRLFCLQNNLPALTVLVVNQDTGRPGEGLSNVDDPDAEREEVYRIDWFDIFPPTLKQLEKVYD